MIRYRLCIFLIGFSFFAIAQSHQKILDALQTTSVIKIDDNLDDLPWKKAVPATDFIEWKPDFGKPEDPAAKTLVYILYDNTSVYIGGYCYERRKDNFTLTTD